jgi:hypothetical protein
MSETTATEKEKVEANARKQPQTTGLNNAKETGRRQQETIAKSGPYSLFVVVGALFCVTLAFMAVWIFPTPNVFDQSSEVIAALTATFGVIATLVGTYFGIKATGDARDTVERAHQAELDQRQSLQRLDGSRLPGDNRLSDGMAGIHKSSDLD